MSVSVSVPEELHKKAVEIAEAQSVTVDEVFASAFAEQLAAWEDACLLCVFFAASRLCEQFFYQSQIPKIP